MKPEFLRRLQVHRDRLVREIDTVGIWTRLYQDEVITRHHIDMCKSMSTPSEKLESLLDTLEKRDDICFEKFCRVVLHNNPELVKSCLERDVTQEENTDGDENAFLGSSFSTRELRHQAQNLERQNEKLRRKLERLTKMRMWMEKDTENSQNMEKHEGQRVREIEAKMAGNLKKYKIRNYELTSRRAHRQKREEETEKLRQERKDLEEALGQTVEDISRLEVELKSLSESNVDLKESLLGVKKTNANSIDECPLSTTGASIVSLLSPQDLERIDRNRFFVTEACGDLNRRDLLPMLACLNCITNVQRKSLDQSEDAQLLLNTIRSFSSANYNSFLVCLRKLDQIHIADLLDYGGVAIKLNVGVKKLDEDAKRRDPVKLLNNMTNRETINTVFGCNKIKFLIARLARPNEDMWIEIWVWCQTEDSLRILNGALAAPKALLKQLGVAFEALGISLSGLGGIFSSSGKPVSVKADKNQFNGTFCPCLPYGHIVRKVARQTPENGKRSAITGVAFLNNCAYVVSSGSSSIQVFQSGTRSFEALPEIHVRGLHNPVDMCAFEDYIYILERESECIWKVSASTSTPAECFQGFVAHALSLTPDGHLMLTVRGVHSSLVICKTSDGKAIRDITLPSGMDALWHGLQTAQGDFVVSHRRGEVHQVSRIEGESGKLCNSYTGNSLRLSQPVMDTPCHMTSEYDERRIYVADQKNRRVLMFDAELQVPRVLLMIEGGCPNRLSFNQDTGQLLVGLDNGVVEVYAVNEFNGIPEESEANSGT